MDTQEKQSRKTATDALEWFLNFHGKRIAKEEKRKESKNG